MKAVLIDDHTKKLYIGEAEKPEIGPNELLVKVKATALNRADLLQKRGLYPPPEGASPIMGLEMSGVVEEVGSEVADWKKGDRVCALLPGGGYAEYAAIPSGMAISIPENLSFEEAAGIPEVFLTAYLNMFWKGNLQKDEWILIHAGASGVGTAAIQLAREIGARIIVTAGSEEKRQLCLELGADYAIDYKAGPFAPKVMEITSGQGVDVIFDFVGASYWEQNIEALAIDGKLIVLGTLGGPIVKEVDLRKFFKKRIHLIGTALRTQPVETKIQLTKDFTQYALEKFATGKLKPIIDSIWDWEKVNEAHEHMEQNRNKGKIILKVQ